jgi:uncharacterized protein YjbJ (UPF0337 family)
MNVKSAACRLTDVCVRESKGAIAMGSEDKWAGKAKQARGKANEIAGAVKGDTAQEIKGKVQKAVGKAQEKVGKMTGKK